MYEAQMLVECLLRVSISASLCELYRLLGSLCNFLQVTLQHRAVALLTAGQHAYLRTLRRQSVVLYVTTSIQRSINPLESRGNYSATSNYMTLVHGLLTGGLLHLVQRGGDWAGPQPSQDPPRCNVTSHPSTASVPITVLVYNSPLLCSFNLFIKG